MLAWNEDGEGLVMQVTTPSWPAAGSYKVSAQGDGNTLGCVSTQNNINNAQHFFALKLDKNGVHRGAARGWKNASVVTDQANAQIVRHRRARRRSARWREGRNAAEENGRTSALRTT